MAKFFIFLLLWRLLGNPFVAILVLLAVLYLLDRRFLGFTPSFLKPLRRRSRIARLRRELALSPNDTSAKHELARLLLERRDYREARKVLEPLSDILESSAEYWDDLGNALIHTGEPERGEDAVIRALELNPRVKYGEPYLRLAELHAAKDRDKALRCLEAFRDIHSSSAEAHYRMGVLYRDMGRPAEAKAAFREALDVYRSLPRYKKRQERKWALRSYVAGR